MEDFLLYTGGKFSFLTVRSGDVNNMRLSQVVSVRFVDTLALTAIPLLGQW